LFESERDHVRHRDAEQSILGRPGHRRTDLLVAQHASQSTVKMHREVEHRSDVERREIAVGELARARVRVRIVGDDRFAGGERLEVSGITAGFELHARAVAIEAALVQVDAQQRRAAFAVTPDRDALDGHQTSGGLGNELQGLLEILAIERVAAHQRDQSGLLLEQALASDAGRGDPCTCLHVIYPRVHRGTQPHRRRTVPCEMRRRNQDILISL
jgi:hypothetical protein